MIAVKASETTLWSVVLYAPVTKVKTGQADFTYELSQYVRQLILTHEDNRGMEQKKMVTKKSFAKALWIKKPSPLASAQDTAEEASAMSHCHIL